MVDQSVIVIIPCFQKDSGSYQGWSSSIIKYPTNEHIEIKWMPKITDALIMRMLFYGFSLTVLSKMAVKAHVNTVP